jgi:hypothetical protein
LKEVIEYIHELAKSLFTGQLIINFHKGRVGKIQVTRTIKNTELKKVK